MNSQRVGYIVAWVAVALLLIVPWIIGAITVVGWAVTGSGL